MASISLADAQPPFVLVLDLGTSSLRALLFDARARAVQGFAARRAYRADTDDNGRATFDARALFATFGDALDELVSRIDFEIGAVAASSLASNLLALDENDEPLTPAYLYADTQNARAVDALRAAHAWDALYARTGCPLHTSYLPARLVWLRETQPAIFARAKRWVSLYEFFLLKIFGQSAVSHSFAAWSGLLNQTTLDWDDEILQIANMRRAGPRWQIVCGCPRWATARWQILAAVVWMRRALPSPSALAARCASFCPPPKRWRNCRAVCGYIAWTKRMVSSG
ncbi:MAG: hypothetical protein DCC52_02845 [Chloroflexi bacterium]|nr:MAG: hypothetical protein DCC52_02845 [Chloroflexota bacterium]